MHHTRRTFLTVTAAAGLTGAFTSSARADGVQGVFPAELIAAARDALVCGMTGPLTRVCAGMPNALVDACGEVDAPAFAILQRFLCDVHAVIGPFQSARVIATGGACASKHGPDRLMVRAAVRPGVELLMTTGPMPVEDAYISLRGAAGEIYMGAKSLRFNDANLACATRLAPCDHAMPLPSAAALHAMARESWRTGHMQSPLPVT